MVSLPCIGSDHHDVVCPNDGDNHGVTLPNDGTILKHKQGVYSDNQDKDPELIGPSIDDDNHGSDAHTTICLGPGVAEVLSSEMSHGMSQIGVPHFMHAKHYSVCNGVDAEAHKITHSRQSYCCCCRRAACCVEDWLDHFEDGSVFGCLFEAEVNPDMLNAAHAGVANTVKARNDKPVCPCENIMSTSISNSCSLQADQKC